MARFSVHAHALLILGCWITFSSGAVPLSLEGKLHELEVRLKTNANEQDKINILLVNKVNELEEKVKQLEAQLEQHNEIKQDLKLKVTQLEAKNVQLEYKVRKQETTITSGGKSGIMRTCQELHDTDPSLPSGMYSIDPDGDGVGNSPIYVYCNMTSGSTVILHDSESSVNVGHCTDPGCYSRSINYNASMGQIRALVKLSAECHQSIKYECYYAPFEFGNTVYAWWNDRNGNPQYFWAGNNMDGIHTCQCGISGNCADNSLKCNCDTAAPVQLVDDGVITDKNILPITSLNFGRTQLETSSGVHTLGRFECSGTVPDFVFPTSCEDLWLVGHTLNGLYFVMGSTMMESVYCDFTKLPDDAGFQKWIGYADVKSAPVHFYVQRNSSFTGGAIPIPFDLERLNVGNAFNLTSGIFTAPRSGTYFFSFMGSARFPSSPSVWLGVGIYWNDRQSGMAWVEDVNTPSRRITTVSLQSTLNLKKGDQIWLKVSDMSGDLPLFDDDHHHTHFTGFMLQEDIIASI
ncbi:uncharacterized protein LOC124205942 [Daphnia pulex]|uniref:uncharacterized protein LOC124205942 n=1 Tax=Daphnia pulex TaxID=6669 RepID=UPI001EDE14A9|nr:uncharacterized protein LOC124205942 [Daphnia pulex]